MRAQRVPDLSWESPEKRQDAGVHDARNEDLEDGLDADKVAYRDSGYAGESRRGYGAEGESEARARAPQRHRVDDRERHFSADGRQRAATSSEWWYQSRSERNRRDEPEKVCVHDGSVAAKRQKRKCQGRCDERPHHGEALNLQNHPSGRCRLAAYYLDCEIRAEL